MDANSAFARGGTRLPRSEGTRCSSAPVLPEQSVGGGRKRHGHERRRGTDAGESCPGKAQDVLCSKRCDPPCRNDCRSSRGQCCPGGTRGAGGCRKLSSAFRNCNRNRERNLSGYGEDRNNFASEAAPGGR